MAKPMNAKQKLKKRLYDQQRNAAKKKAITEQKLKSKEYRRKKKSDLAEEERVEEVVEQVDMEVQQEEEIGPIIEALRTRGVTAPALPVVEVPTSINYQGRVIELTHEAQDDIWKFIHQEMFIERAFEEVDNYLWEEYFLENDLHVSVEEMNAYFTHVMCPSLYKSYIGPRKIIELYATLKHPMSPIAEATLEAPGKVLLRLDKDRVLQSFRFIGDTMLYDGEVPKDLYVSKELKSRMWKSVELNINTREIMCVEFWKNFQINEELIFSSPTLLLKSFQKLLADKTIWNCVYFDIETALIIAKTLSLGMSRGQQSRILRDHNVEVQLDGSKIVSWKRHYNRNRSPTPPEFNMEEEAAGAEAVEPEEVEVKPTIPVSLVMKNTVTDTETMLMWSFIWRKVFDTSLGRPTGRLIRPRGTQIWEQFIEEKETTRTAWSLATHYRKNMMYELHKENFKKEQILWLHKLLAIRVDNQILDNLRHRFNVEIIMSGEFVYGWRDLSLNLPEPEALANRDDL